MYIMRWVSKTSGGTEWGSKCSQPHMLDSSTRVQEEKKEPAPADKELSTVAL